VMSLTNNAGGSLTNHGERLDQQIFKRFTTIKSGFELARLASQFGIAHCRHLGGVGVDIRHDIG